jgi:hypothetical protein
MALFNISPSQFCIVPIRRHGVMGYLGDNAPIRLECDLLALVLEDARPATSLVTTVTD